jgi:hypothetical protein
VLGHPSADAPYIANLAGLQQSITARRISNIQHAPSLSLPFLRAVVGQLRKRLRSADTHAYSPGIDPLTALGIEARSAEERRRYADLQVQAERRRVEKELAYQRAYDEAFARA